MPQRQRIVGEVVDLFCGVGALSHGLKLAGFAIKAGYDLDARCKHAFEKNNQAPFFPGDVSRLTGREIAQHFSKGATTVLAGCAPCQPFSTYKQRYAEDPQWELVNKFATIAAEGKPHIVTMENVPALLRYKGGEVFRDFVRTLEAADYHVWHEVVDCSNFGVPQRRKRLVVVASRREGFSGLQPVADATATVRAAISMLEPLAAGATSQRDRIHTTSKLSPINLRRIRASRPGGTWRDWPQRLRADCHRRESGKTYPGVYARMEWDKPAPTITTQAYGYGNGRFGHPDQDRAISLREAALLQTFPANYEFISPNENVSFKEIGRWIGNAVPVELGKCIGISIARHICEDVQ